MMGMVYVYSKYVFKQNLNQLILLDMFLITRHVGVIKMSEVLQKIRQSVINLDY